MLLPAIENVPEEHAVGSAAPTPQIQPAGQRIHMEELQAEKVPASQLAQTVEPVKFDIFPAGQIEGEMEPTSGQKDPTGHKVHMLASSLSL
jgi:hypothetical protein